jgi:hypothetical protein
VYANGDSRSPASPPAYQQDSSALRALVIPLSDQSQNKMVILGSDRSTNSGAFVTMKATDLGLPDDGRGAFEPMFLFFVNSQGIHDLYSFSLGSFNRSTFGLMPKLLDDRDYVDRVQHPENYPDLPMRLADLNRIKKEQVKSWALRLFVELAELTDASILMKPYRMWKAENNHLRTRDEGVLVDAPGGFGIRIASGAFGSAVDGQHRSRAAGIRIALRRAQHDF